MNKIKPEIKVNNLSWEKKSLYICDNKSCKNEGKYKAPKSKIDLNNYYLFCLEHIRKYNKSWDYYKGMSIDEIEFSLRQDVIWNRPSWPTQGSSRGFFKIINTLIYNRFGIFRNNEKIKKYFRNNEKFIVLLQMKKKE